jgi:hypothetical protein
MRSMRGGLFPVVEGPCKRYVMCTDLTVTVTVTVTEYLWPEWGLRGSAAASQRHSQTSIRHLYVSLCMGKNDTLKYCISAQTLLSLLRDTMRFKPFWMDECTDIRHEELEFGGTGLIGAVRAPHLLHDLVCAPRKLCTLVCDCAFKYVCMEACVCVCLILSVRVLVHMYLSDQA